MSVMMLKNVKVVTPASQNCSETKQMRSELTVLTANFKMLKGNLEFREERTYCTEHFCATVVTEYLDVYVF